MASTDADDFREYKKNKPLIRERRPDEEEESYIKDVWPLVISPTESEGVKKVWLTHSTAVLVSSD